MEGYEASTYGDRFADVYDDWYADVTDVEACVACVAELVAEAGGGSVLELGVGSGRLAIPLAQRGLDVHGLDASAAMLERLAAKPGGELVHASVGDMTSFQPDGPAEFAVVLLAFNTLFNLPTDAAQRACFDRCAGLLAPAGALVVEAFVPGDAAAAGPSSSVEARHIGVDEVVLAVSRSDPASQTVSGQHVQLTEAGIRLRPWHLRWATPAQLDEMAAAAGLDLAWRSAGWRREHFDDESRAHVSCWRRARSAAPRGER